MSTHNLLSLVGMLAIAGPLRAQSDSTWRDHNRAARAAYVARDFAGYRAHLLALQTMLSGHARVMYSLAGADARLGDSTSAMRRLRAYADMGLTADAAADSDFITLRDSPTFREIVARLDANARPVERGTVAFTIADRDLVPEDIAYDPRTRTFYLSSARKRKIIAVDRRGIVSDFVREGQDSLWSVLALALDAKRGVLWATTSAEEMMPGYPAADSGRAALVQYDLRSGKQLARYELPRDGQRRQLGDMALDQRGDLFVSDGQNGILYVLRRGTEALEPLTPTGALASPQGPTVAPDGRIYLADYTRGIAIVDPRSGSVRWLTHGDDVALNGIDGLTYYDHSLIAVQNGTSPKRLLRLDLDASGERVVRQTILASGGRLSEPTHGALVGEELYLIANSGWDKLAADGSLKPGAALEEPVVVRVRVK
jgi:hypothetical protein